MQKNPGFFISCLVCLAFLLVAASPSPPDLNPNPPDEPVRLIFIHHSTGENWLTDGYGNLGRELGNNNYFVSDTNYGWGPDAIGDRTDIPNWTEWFRSPQTPTYMDALFKENSQNSNYTRTLADPGGENQIIMFKSCFPNSALTGHPDDPPGTYEELSVSGAKYVYNEILKYFATRPDKLFIVITAPPLSDPTYAQNARAFNQWLMEDWLADNDYTLNNVAVFDFYNVLTDLDAHHRYNNGEIEYIVKTSNTLAYPSADDHPSEQGSRKATEEFIPLLNIFYHRWKATAPASTQAATTTVEPAPAESRPQPSTSGAAATAAGMIDDFEGGSPSGTYDWKSFRDEATSTRMRCAADAETAHGGSRSLILDFDMAANSWATCALIYESKQNWSAAQGLTFYLHAQKAGLVFDVDVYTGSLDAKETYLYTIETPPESVSGWVPFSLKWSDFHRASWEEHANETFNKSDQIVGLAFGLNTEADKPNTGRIWVDDLALLGSEPASAAPAEPAGEASPRGFSLPCGSAFALPITLIAFTLTRKKYFH